MYQCNLRIDDINTLILCQSNLKGIIYTRIKNFSHNCFILYINNDIFAVEINKESL